MHLPRTRHLAASGLALATVAAAAMVADGGSAGASRTEARTVSGTIAAVVWTEAKITVDGSEGPVTLHIDRNTAVFLEDRLGSARDLAVGVPVRASFDGDQRAAWIEVRPRGSTSGGARDGGAESAHAGARDAGTRLGPPVLAPPAGHVGAPDGGQPDGGSQPSSPDPATPSPPREVPAGPPPPEPGRGPTPPPPRQPGPTGPGPVGPQR